MQKGKEIDELLSSPKEELDKLKVVTEIRKLNREYQLLSKHPLTLPSAYVPLIVSLIGLGGVIVKLDREVDTARAAEVSTASYASGLKTALEKVSPESTTATVNIRFRGSISRQLITIIQQRLNTNGFIAPRPTRTAQITSSEIRYFAQADKETAENVAKQVSEAFGSTGCVVMPTLMFQASNERKTHIIELDIYASC